MEVGADCNWQMDCFKEVHGWNSIAFLEGKDIY